MDNAEGFFIFRNKYDNVLLHQINHITLRSGQFLLLVVAFMISLSRVILKSVAIVSDVVIAAGSAVNKDIPAYCVVNGLSAKVIKENKNEECKGFGYCAGL